ncbi:MAG: 3-isopropylmalate dehydratase large subunit, partial [Clostridiales bacterium]|nr:3-isopropylmalate dehydratase large subunit [Clostridiales bacterium]
LKYVSSRAKRPFKVFEADSDAPYDEVIEIDLNSLKPTIAKPHLPSNTVTADEIERTEIQQVVIGSCTNGRLEDLRTAAEILKGRRVAQGVRLIIIPATQLIYLDCLREGLIETFIQAGGAVSTPTCGPCLGGHMGILAAGERAVATTNRNFVGRMGHPKSEVYLAGPAVAAESAVRGYIAQPD